MLSLAALVLAAGASVACGDDFPNVPSPKALSASAADDAVEPMNEPAPELSEQPTPEPVAVTQTNTLATNEPGDEVPEQPQQPEQTEAEEEDAPAPPVDGAGLGEILDQMAAADTAETAEPEPAPSATEVEPQEPAPVEPEPSAEPPEEEEEEVVEPETEPEVDPEPEPEVTSDPVVFPPANDGNLLDNPGFEDGTTDWEAWGGELTAVADPVHSGGSSGQASARTDTWNGAARDILALVEAGNTYRASAWATTSGSGQTVGLTVKTVCGTTEEYIKVATSTSSVGTWTELSGSFTVPTCSLQSLTLYVEGPSVGTDLFIDDMSLSAQ